MSAMVRKSGGGPSPFSKVLREHFQALGWERKFRELEIFQRWEEAVGPQIARRARPSHVRNHRLTVIVDSAAWAQQLALMKREMLSSITRILGEDLVSDLYFVSGTVEGQRLRRRSAHRPARVVVVPAWLDRALERDRRRTAWVGGLRTAFG